jgi:YidC/Oxa1 family membrane protein insertase
MQDQGKRLLLAVALALGVFLVWNMLAPQEPPPPTPADQKEMPRPATPQVGVTDGGAAAGATGTAPAARAGAADVAEAPRPPEALLTLSFDNFVATFSSYCGGLKSWRLIDKRYDNDATRGWLLPEKSLMTMSDAAGKSVPVPPAQQEGLPACGAFDVNFASSTYVVPRNAVWTGTQVSATEVRYTYASEPLEVEKTFTVIPQSYLVRMAVKVNVRPPQGVVAKQQLTVSAFGFQDPAKVQSGNSWLGGVTPRAWGSATLRGGELLETPVASAIEWPRYEPAIQWTGFEHPYLLVGFAPRLERGEHVEKYTVAADGKTNQPRGFMRTDMLFAASMFKQGDAPMTREVIGYLGPKNYDNLEQADVAAGFSTGFSQVIDLGWFAFIGRPLLWLLQKFYELAGNWGISIILLTFLVKALTLYWTTKSMRSMKAMAALAPQLKALQAKYGDDKQRLQAETMALYKQHNVNPIAGCLPILLQMPIWIALYRMLSSAGELYQQPMIPGWVDDLTATDPYYILPAILVVTMFIQARLQPATVDSRQQKFLQYGMPLMFGVMSFVFPAGLTLYIFTNTVLSALHSIYMNKFDKKSLAVTEQLKKNQEAAAALAATGGAKSTVKNGGPAKPRRPIDSVIDVKATEVVSGATTDDGADDDDAPGPGGPGMARNRPRRKKRKR